MHELLPTRYAAKSLATRALDVAQACGVLICVLGRWTWASKSIWGLNDASCWSQVSTQSFRMTSINPHLLTTHMSTRHCQSPVLKWRPAEADLHFSRLCPPFPSRVPRLGLLGIFAEWTKAVIAYCWLLNLPSGEFCILNVKRKPNFRATLQTDCFEDPYWSGRWLPAPAWWRG